MGPAGVDGRVGALRHRCRRFCWKEIGSWWRMASSRGSGCRCRKEAGGHAGRAFIGDAVRRAPCPAAAKKIAGQAAGRFPTRHYKGSLPGGHPARRATGRKLQLATSGQGHPARLDGIAGTGTDGVTSCLHEGLSHGVVHAGFRGRADAFNDRKSRPHMSAAWQQDLPSVSSITPRAVFRMTVHPPNSTALPA